MTEIDQNSEPTVLTTLTLVPVEVFGGDCDCHELRPVDVPGRHEPCDGWGYGLSDAVQGWSDCNRAHGRIYRAEDTDATGRLPGETVTIHVAADQLPFFERRWGEPRDNNGEAATTRRGAEDLRAVTAEVDHLRALKQRAREVAALGTPNAAARPGDDPGTAIRAARYILDGSLEPEQRAG